MEREHDIVISYAFGGTLEQRLIDQTKAILKNLDIRVYIIDKSNKLPERRWKRLYFEALVNSHFVVPVLTDKYLLGSSARLEMTAITPIVDRRIYSSYFHPLVPIVPSLAYLGESFLEVERHPGLDFAPYEWLKTHAFPISMDWGPAAVGTFFKSIVRGQRGEHNLDWLGVVAPFVSGLRFEHRLGRPCVTVQVRNTTFDHDHEFTVGVGGVRYGGCHYIRRDAINKVDARALVAQVEQHVSCGRDGRPIAICRDCNYRMNLSASGATPECCDVCSGQVERHVDYLETPNIGNSLICNTCGRHGHPVAYEISAECTHCSGLMSLGDAEQAKHMFLDSFGQR